MKILILSAFVSLLPLAAAAAACDEHAAAGQAKSGAVQVADAGCVNVGGNCNGELPCCGTASCVRGRCVEVPENALLASKAKQKK